MGGPGSPLSGVAVMALGWSAGRVLTAGTAGGVWQLRGGAWARLGGAGPAGVDALAACPDGALVAGTGGGIWKWAGGRWAQVPGPPSGSPAVACLPDGGVLSGSFGAGVWEAAPGSGAAVELGGAASPLSHFSVLAIALGRAGSVYAGTNSDGVWRYGGLGAGAGP